MIGYEEIPPQKKLTHATCTPLKVSFNYLIKHKIDQTCFCDVISIYSAAGVFVVRPQFAGQYCTQRMAKV